MTPKALEPGFGLKVATILFVLFWTVLAAFPLVWIALMSFKLPVDAFATDPLAVIAGPATRENRGGLSVIGILFWLGAAFAFFLAATRLAPRTAAWLGPGGARPVGWLATAVLFLLALVLAAVWVVPVLIAGVERVFSFVPLLDRLATPLIGFTGEHYRAVWVGLGFYNQFFNSMTVTLGTVAISLTVGTLAGYGLARGDSDWAFWILITALVFRALPHSVLVTGYLPPFINSREILQPFWDAPGLGAFLRLFAENPPTLYGQTWAVILVLVAINQPFTIWMLRSFFLNVPRELDEAARVDGCTHLGAFWRVVMPVMWPGVITTGLFSFLLAYNDYLVCSLLLNAQNQTMVPAITGFFNRETTVTDQVQAVAAAVSITAPLFLLVMVFQRQLVSGLTQGAVKG
ncbi:MAG: ABC transporter permease [Mesorhizobium amorphae]|nr:MAG: ABC transporter permease [Mesorhizobium amorphae]